jgi:hypothetical protein
MALHLIKIWSASIPRKGRVIMVVKRVRSTCRQKRSSVTNMPMAASTKDSGRVTKGMARVLSHGPVEALTAVSFRTTVEMVKVKCFTQMARSTMERGETTHVMEKVFLNGLKAQVNSREISETIRCTGKAL